MDGNAFIRFATRQLLDQHVQVDITPRKSHQRKEATKKQRVKRTVLTRSRTFDHYILNLPASALTFLPSFVGVYAGHEREFVTHTEVKFPLVHVYCFRSTLDQSEAEHDVCEEISRHLSYDMKAATNPEEFEGATWVFNVRDVAPNKTMYCATFRLPAEVALRSSQ